jgi:hypothetical protein
MEMESQYQCQYNIDAEMNHRERREARKEGRQGIATEQQKKTKKNEERGKRKERKVGTKPSNKLVLKSTQTQLYQRNIPDTRYAPLGCGRQRDQTTKCTYCTSTCSVMAIQTNNRRTYRLCIGAPLTNRSTLDRTGLIFQT